MDVAWKKTAAEDGKTVQYTTLKVRLYPSEAQVELFENTFGCCRWIWNHMLADQQRFYLETGKHFIPTPAKYKSGAPFLKEVDNQALIQEHGKLSQAVQVFLKNATPSPPAITILPPAPPSTPPATASA